MLVRFHFRARCFLAHGLDAEPDFLLLNVHLDDLEVMLESRLQRDRLSIRIHRFGVVAEALDSFRNLDECAKARHAENLALENVSNMMLLEEALPNIRL